MLANCLLRDTFITLKRVSVKPYTIISPDIRRKEFDTLPHTSINTALIHMSIDGIMRTCLISDLTSSETNIKVGKTNTGDIHFRKGVKQGATLSHILFNLVIGGLLDEIDR